MHKKGLQNFIFRMNIFLMRIKHIMIKRNKADQDNISNDKDLIQRLETTLIHWNR